MCLLAHEAQKRRVLPSHIAYLLVPPSRPVLSFPCISRGLYLSILRCNNVLYLREAKGEKKEEDVSMA